MTQNTDTAAALQNVSADTSKVVHKGKMVRLMGHRTEKLVPACRSLAQLERQRVSGFPTDAPVTCTRAKCQG